MLGNSDKHVMRKINNIVTIIRRVDVTGQYKSFSLDDSRKQLAKIHVSYGRIFRYVFNPVQFPSASIDYFVTRLHQERNIMIHRDIHIRARYIFAKVNCYKKI